MIGKNPNGWVNGWGLVRLFVSGEVFSGFRVLGFDLETTGFDVRKERIVEYALVGSDVDGSHINLQSLVNPGKRIPIVM